MAEFVSEDDGIDKNFILAKLVSIFGDSVDFDVINIVAQENEWNESKCIESLTVLGEYKNPPAIVLPEEIKSEQLSKPTSDRAAHDKRQEASSSSSFESRLQRKKTSNSPPVTNHKAPLSNYSVSSATYKKSESAQRMYPSAVEPSSPMSKKRSSETQEHHDQVKNLIASETKVLILIRGLPGSGKSSLSKQLLAHPGGKSGCTCSADDFFLVPSGGKGQKEYRFDPLRLDDAHKHCRVQALRAMAHGVSPIIVDNTNTQAWEMLPYVEMALEPWKAEENLRKMVASGSIAKRNICNSLGPSRNSCKGKKCNCGFTVMEPVIVPYQVELLEPLTWWYQNPSRLAKENQHGVSQRKITQMLSHFEYGLTGKDLIKQILKKKQQKNHNLHPELQSHPAAAKVRPFKGKKASAQLSGPPLFTSRANHGKTNANKLPNPFAFGSNQFQHPSKNPFPNFIGVPPVPYMQPVLYSPNMFSVGSGGHPGVVKVSEAEPVDSKEQLNLAIKENHVENSSSNPLFPGIKPSSIFSSQESRYNSDSVESTFENVSSKNDTIGPNPFLKSLNVSEQEINTSNIFQGECIEISEEEEKEWMQANASKYINWKSSEEEESGDEMAESCEPKPARSYREKRVNLEVANSIGKSSGDSDCQEVEGNEDIIEWAAEDGDHLASWNVSSSCSNDTTASKDCSETKTEGPLPPRSPKRKLPVGNSPKDTNDAEQPVKASNPTEGHEFDWIKDIRLLLKALGLNKDDSNSPILSSNDTEIVGNMTSPAVESSDNATCDSKNQNKTDSALTQDEIQIEIDYENTVNSQMENTVKMGAANIKTQEECKIESLSHLVTNQPLESLVAETTSAAEAIAKVENIDQVADVVIANEPQAEKIISSDIPGESGNLISVKVFDEFLVSQSELKDGVSKMPQNAPEDSILKGARNVSSEKCDHGMLKTDDANENEIQLPRILNDDHVNNSGDITQIQFESNSLEDKNELVKMSVLKSLLIGIEKAQKRSPEEFESSGKLRESFQTENSILPVHGLQLEEVKALSLGSGEIQTDVKSKQKLTEDIEKNESCETVIETSEAVSSPHTIFTTMGANSKEPESIEKCTEHSILQKKQYDFDVFQSLPDNFSHMEESLDKSVLIKDPGCNNLSSLVSISSKESSSFFMFDLENNTPENKTDNLIELNLPEEENPGTSFTVITNKNAMVHENPTLPTAMNLFEKAGNYFLKGFGENNEKSTTSNTASSILFNEGEATKITKTDSGIGDFIAGEELLTNVSSDSMEADSEFNCDDDSDETYPLVLDPTFVDLLYRTFGNPYEEPLYESQKLPNGPTTGVAVNIPPSLARQLHECLLKSQWDSILADDEISQKMVIEDELLAMQLQELEKEDLKDARNQSNPSSTTPNLREIMDMEMAMAMYKADQSKTIQVNQRTDMSTRLTWDLLVKEFPQVPQNVIAQIFSAYDYSYANAREALLASLPEYERDSHANPVKDVVSLEAIAAQEKALLEKAKMESLKFQERGLLVEEESEEEEANGVEGSWKEMVEEARKSAALNRRLQKERHAQAQAANRSGIASAAAYYCQMATLHKQKAEEETRKAANILSKVFTGKYGSSEGKNVGTSTWTSPPPTLDMHSMKVAEAVTVMNAFLDAHIEWLRDEKSRPHADASRKSSPTKSKTLFLVTGRGMNSLGGIPRIKPAVERQLEMRGVWYEEMNPGLLRVMVSASQPMKRKV